MGGITDAEKARSPPVLQAMDRSRAKLSSTSASVAIVRAERLARREGNVGAVAFSRTGDPGSGGFADAVVLKSFDVVPAGLRAFNVKLFAAPVSGSVQIFTKPFLIQAKANQIVV